MMQGAFPTQGKASSIPTIFNWGGNIRPESFLSFVLLSVVIIVAVATVVLVVVDAIVGVVVVENSSVNKLSLVIIGSLH
ncbi:hypothetical protein Tco_0557763, partial [Tanacetum coccineum]